MINSRTKSKYIQALQEVSKLDKEPIALTYFATPVASINVSIFQDKFLNRSLEILWPKILFHR